MALKKKIYFNLLMLFILPNGILLGDMFIHSFDIFTILAVSILFLGLTFLLVNIQQFFKSEEKRKKETTGLPVKKELADHSKENPCISQIQPTVQKLQEDMNQIKDLAGNVLKGATLQAQNVEKSTDSMTEISEAIEHIATSTQSVANSSKTTNEAAKKGFDSLNIVIGQMEAIHQSVDHLSTVISDLAKYSNDIGQIIETITDISGQTNLLALNAAIEAARAGEHGRGFAVVADEVKKLSEEVKLSSQQITSIVSSIHENVEKSVNFMAEGKEKVTNGIQVVNNVKSTFELIQEKINDVSNQILEVSATVQQLSAGSDEISNTTDFTRKVQSSGVNMIKELDTIIQGSVGEVEKVNRDLHNFLQDTSKSF